MDRRSFFAAVMAALGLGAHRREVDPNSYAVAACDEFAPRGCMARAGYIYVSEEMGRWKPTRALQLAPWQRRTDFDSSGRFRPAVIVRKTSGGGGTLPLVVVAFGADACLFCADYVRIEGETASIFLSDGSVHTRKRDEVQIMARC
jgi:hypothetical protein